MRELENEAEAMEGSGTEPVGLVSRFVGILFSPADTFKAVLAAPRWLDMLALTAMVMAVYTLVALVVATFSGGP